VEIFAPLINGELRKLIKWDFPDLVYSTRFHKLMKHLVCFFYYSHTSI
jgi:hypothetical protein